MKTKTRSRAIRPPKLSPGDTVRVVSMSGTFPKDSWETARFFTDALGLKLQIGKSMFRDPGYLGRDPEKRADDFNDALSDDRVRGIFLFRGGNSASETLPWLDFDLLRKKPKVVAGFSDHSSVVIAAHACSGVNTFLIPPSVQSTPSARHLSTDSFRRLVMDGEAWVAMPPHSTQTWRKGTARGRLLATNLRVLSYLMGTPYQPSLDGVLLAWEEIGEELQDVNTILSQLRNAGVLAKVRGMIVGHLEGMKTRDDGFSVADHVLDKFAAGPVLKTKAFGHFRPCFTLPLGPLASLDAGKGTLVIEESAVE